MPLEGSYAVWNNRGGSGKTNLTYHLAIKYAYRNPDKTVLVVDMCPQADLSHAFLGKKLLKIIFLFSFSFSFN
jgi:cellulose biosynthesis protein BcsQ